MTDTMMEAPVLDTPPPSRDRKTVLVAGGVVAALALGFGGYKLMSGGDPVAAPLLVKHLVKPVVQPVTPVAPVKAATKPKAKPVALPPTSTTPLGRDPFKPLYVVPPVAVPVTATTTTTAAAPTAAAPASDPAATPSYVISLKSVDSSNPQLRKYVFVVSGVSKSVVQSQKFGKYGELVVLAVTTNSSGKVTGALVQVGDGTPFTLKIGEKATVA
jgi:hypothetical protein